LLALEQVSVYCEQPGEPQEDAHTGLRSRGLPIPHELELHRQRFADVWNRKEMAGVRIRNVGKCYGQFEAVKNLSVNIENREFVILVGPSGCGKSTLLRMIAGLENIDSGEINIDGAVVNDLPPKARDIAMVFQNYALYPHMTVAENMGFSLRLARLPRAEISRKVEEAAQILGIRALLDRYPKQLSGGQRQRVAMGRAIVRNPKVFLFDEPLSNLDAKLRVQMRSEIKDLHRRLGTTTIYVTHDQIEAMTMADKIVVMRSGNIEQVGSPLEVYDCPQTRFVADFIGSPSMNFIEGALTQIGFRTPDNLLIPIQNKGLPTGDMPAVYGIRPEHLTLSESGVPAKVVVVEPTGSETHIVLKIGDQQVVGAFRGRISVGYDDTVCIMPDLEKVHLFDSDGRRIN
jgi:multiple sugar transport system ATP-binding protein